MIVGIDEFLVIGGRSTATVLADYSTEKARVPIVESLNGGTTRRLVPAERRDCRQADRQHEQLVRDTLVRSLAEP